MQPAPLQTRTPQSGPVEWITKEEAAKLLDKSVRTVLAMAADGRIQSKRERLEDKGGQYVTLLHAGDVARLACSGNETGVQVARRPAASLQPMAIPPQYVADKAPAPAPRPWLTLDEAAEYSGLPAAFLLVLVKSSKLPALDVGVRKGGRYRVCRRAIDTIEGTLNAE